MKYKKYMWEKCNKYEKPKMSLDNCFIFLLKNAETALCTCFCWLKIQLFKNLKCLEQENESFAVSNVQIFILLVKICK